MTDQTPVTDDDRRTAYEWAASLDPDIRCWNDRERAAARVILATVPDPTLSEEWRDMLEKQDAGEVVSFSGLLARTVQMEHELAEALDSRLVPAPRVITAPGELDALDGETIIGTKDGYIASATELRLFVRPHNANKYLPAVVIGDGSHVRYCWTALEGETK